MQRDDGSSRRPPQRLPTRFLDTCDACGKKVVFLSRGGRALDGNPNFRVAYLYCPLCGATATQVQEVMGPDANGKSRHRKVKYRYKG